MFGMDTAPHHWPVSPSESHSTPLASCEGASSLEHWPGLSKEHIPSIISGVCELFIRGVILAFAYLG